MTTIVEDAIAELTAAVVREIDPPTGDFGFGTDLSCTSDITADAAEVASDSPLAVAEANFRRLTTPRGKLPDDPDYGIDIASFLHQGMTPHRQVEIVGIIKAELFKDDRNETLTVQVSAPSLRVLNIDIRGTCAQGPFSLTMALTNGDVLLEAISGNA